jgi:2-phosphoglycolate phosphatase
VTDPRSLAPPVLEPARLRGIIFDLDGTLVDSFGAIAASLNRARARYALDPLSCDEVRRHVGRGLERLVADLVGSERVDGGVRCFREHYARVFLEMTSALPGALSTLRRLRRRGYRLAVASNKPTRFAEPILRRLGMSSHLDAVQGPDTAGRTKPDPAMLDACLDAIGTKRDQALYVGDMVLDVETARRARLPVVLVPGGASTEVDLRATGQRVLSRLEELTDLLPA